MRTPPKFECFCAAGPGKKEDTKLPTPFINPFESSRKMGKLWKIHFRNVTAPIPDFVETYIDNGYIDMWKLMKTLVDVDFRGNLIADHVPAMPGGYQPAWSSSMGYIRALNNAAREEKGA